LHARGFHLGEQLILAVEAAVVVVASVVWVFEFAGLENVDGNAVLRREGKGRGQFLAGQRGRVGNYGEHTSAQSAMDGVGKIGRVRTAGVGDQQ
jgi:hypothetical protein